MTPYQKAGFNELSLFRVLPRRDDHTVGKIVWLHADDETPSPYFSSKTFSYKCMTFGYWLQELPKDSDGYYLWDGGECPVPGDWVVSVKYTGETVPSEDFANLFKWDRADILAFKPISRPDMVSADHKPVRSNECPDCGDEDCSGGMMCLAGAVISLRDREESDPTGRNPHESGAKLDAGKNRLGLVLNGFSRALSEVGKVGTYGANKYTDNGWVDVPNGEARYTDAMYRHLMAEASGQLLDSDTQLRHAAHAAWNALARLELALIAMESK